MDEVAAGLRRARAGAALVPLFIGSGATGLVYQTVWSRQLHLVFGTSTLAVATVLAAFMGGLALGGAWAARVVDRVQRPLAAYGALEAAIGLWALAFPSLLGWAAPGWIALTRAWALDAGARAGVQLLVTGLLLVPPTAAMGATLPLLARFAVGGSEDGAGAGDRIGRLYAANTVGAVLGTAVAGFWMLPGLGVWSTTVVVAVANLGLGALAWSLDRTVPAMEATVGGASDDRDGSPARTAAVVAAALAGWAGLVAEVAWFRVLSLNLGASTYAFTVMLLAFLLGIAGGGAVGGRWGDRLLAQGGVAKVLDGLAWASGAVALATAGALWLSTQLPFVYVALFDALRAVRDPTTLWTVKLLVAGLLLTPSTFAMGVAFPLAARAAVGRPGGAGSGVGAVYASNTAGGVLGAALAGFVLLPTLGMRGTVAASVLASLGAALAALGGRRSVGRSPTDAGAWRPVLAGAVGLAGAWVVVPPTWDPLLVTSGMYKYAADLSSMTRDGVVAFAKDPYRLLYYAEGPATVVTVAQAHRSKNVWLANNGKIDASTTADMPTQRLVSVLPLAIADVRDEVGMVGLASGISAGAVTLFDEVGSVEVVELEPATAEAAALFLPWNRDVLHDPRVHLVFDDGRNHLLRQPEGRYDVIVSEPSNPWITGVSNLFTAEFFAMAHTRLRPGGVWSQWVQLYGMDDEDVRTLLATFSDAFAHVEVWGAAEDADLVVLGRDRPFDWDPERLASLFERPILRRALSEIAIDGPGDLLAYRRLDDAAVRRLAEGAPRNTDDNLRIEYRAPRNLHRGTTLDNNALLDRYQVLPLAVVGEDVGLLAATARGYLRREEDDLAVDAFVRAALAVPADDPRREAWLMDAFHAWLGEDTIEASLRAVAEQRFVAEEVAPLLADQAAASSSDADGP